MTRILLTEKNGQVGWELRRTLLTLGEVIAVDHEKMDLANADSIRNVIREAKPALIVNAAAYTAVDKEESEPELAMAISGIAPGIMAEEAKRMGAAIIHYSTDYVFDVVAHWLSTVEHCDRLYRLERGHITGQGNYEVMTRVSQVRA